MRPKRTKVWTLEQRARLAETMRQKHATRRGELAESKGPDPLTPEEIAEIEAEESAKKKAAARFATALRKLVRRDVDAAVDVFRRCGVRDASAMSAAAEQVSRMCDDEQEREPKKAGPAREAQVAAHDFAWHLLNLACGHVPVVPAAEALFRRCGIEDVATMREVATYVFVLCPDPDTTESLRACEAALRSDPKFAEETRR